MEMEIIYSRRPNHEHSQGTFVGVIWFNTDPKLFSQKDTCQNGISEACLKTLTIKETYIHTSESNV